MEGVLSERVLSEGVLSGGGFVLPSSAHHKNILFSKSQINLSLYTVLLQM